jgi:RNA polymerase sigma-70 factor (ECF subfamily)
MRHRVSDLMSDRSQRSVHRRPSLDGNSLAARIQRGDEDALITVVNALWRPLVSYATWLLEDPDAASDVVQESLSHVWMARDHLTIDTSLDAYLYRVVHNRAVDERRRVMRRRHLLERHWRREEPGYGLVTAPAERLSLRLEQALASLPERRRRSSFWHIFTI